MFRLVAVACALFTLRMMTIQASSKFEAMVPGFDEEFMSADNGLTFEQKTLFLELTSLRGHYEKDDLRKIVNDEKLLLKIIKFVRELLENHDVPDGVLDFFDVYLDITHRLEVASHFPPEKRVTTVFKGFTKTLEKYRLLDMEEKEYLINYDITMAKLEKLWAPVILQARTMCRNPMNKAVCKDVV
ncbi:unnamed protein product [Bursaphelenchus okinawaensis]|uniref:Uncharacterized protein n=1 Tax=Bursaphelenchus okinawaensis TaxID=465554 RepID=A0A811JUY8_9BILA|nr:unnamed protein product [Bursaphelenchus okinawaensis]CAG9084851.1 unnamed protein product [Bursaphelenchus okinawaensis]